MIQQTVIKFHLDQGWGDFQNLWLIKYELGKAYNGYLDKGVLAWEEVQEGSADATKLIPFMRVSRYFPVQELVDALTDTKKTTEQVETLSELKATKKHLEDMRHLVFQENYERS